MIFSFFHSPFGYKAGLPPSKNMLMRQPPLTLPSFIRRSLRHLTNSYYFLQSVTLMLSESA